MKYSNIHRLSRRFVVVVALALVCTGCSTVQSYLASAGTNPYDGASLGKLCPTNDRAESAALVDPRNRARFMKSIVGAKPVPIDIIVSSYSVDAMDDTKLTSIEGLATNADGGALVKLKDPSRTYWKSQFGQTIHVSKWVITAAEAEFMGGYLICTFNILELPGNTP